MPEDQVVAPSDSTSRLLRKQLSDAARFQHRQTRALRRQPLLLKLLALLIMTYVALEWSR